MEIKKQFLHVLSIALMLSVIVPAFAAEPKKLTRAQLYRKCIARRCNAAEKARVRADARKAGKWAGVLLLAAVAIIGFGAKAKKLAREEKVSTALVASLLIHYQIAHDYRPRGSNQGRDALIDELVILRKDYEASNPGTEMSDNTLFNKMTERLNLSKPLY